MQDARWQCKYCISQQRHQDRVTANEQESVEISWPTMYRGIFDVPLTPSPRKLLSLIISSLSLSLSLSSSCGKPSETTTVHKPFFSFFTKRLLPWTLSILLSVAIIHLYLYPVPSFLSSSDHVQVDNSIDPGSASPATPSPSPSSSSPPPPLQATESSSIQTACDYGTGKWVRHKIGPLYNGTSCATIKDNQNCMSHGRPDTGYLYWTWKPKRCTVPRFEPESFLQLMRNKHLAFVGDSVARNQLESLLCMVATASSPDLVYTSGEDNRFRKWHFPSHNVSVSIYWSPFLVKGIEKKSDIAPENYNTLYLESVDERWAGDMGLMDMIVLSMGHWFLHPAVYFYGDSVLGCHYCTGQNYTEIGFYDVYGTAFKTALNAIIERRGPTGIAMDVIVTTFSPAHFEGEWDKFGACPKTKPYKPGEKELEGMNAEMRKVELEEIKVAKAKAQEFSNLRFEAVDVTKLSLLRPDGHPGPYLYPFPFANGISDRVQNDCVHWCLPGPIDTWNEILLDIMKKWEGKSER